MTPTVSLPEATVVTEESELEPDDDPPQADKVPKDMIAAQARAIPLAIREWFMVHFFLFAVCCLPSASPIEAESRVPPPWTYALICVR